MPAMRREGRESFIEVRVRERLPDVCLMSQWPVVQIDEKACKAATNALHAASRTLLTTEAC
jgi:hypothetical protein